MKQIRMLFISMCIISTIQAQLVSIVQYDPSIKLELRYAMQDNFLHEPIYEQADAYLVKEALQALIAAQNEFKKYGLGLKVWDAYRPLSEQWKLWRKMSDPRYVSDPRKGGRHTRATTVDVTLIDLKTGKELPMGTDFDDFTQKAYPSYSDLPKHELANRKLLKDTMEKHGFKNNRTEWWHFDFRDWKNYPVLDVPFRSLVR